VVSIVDGAHECAFCVDAWAVDEANVSQQALMSSNNSSRSIIVQMEEASVLWASSICEDWAEVKKAFT